MVQAHRVIAWKGAIVFAVVVLSIIALPIPSRAVLPVPFDTPPITTDSLGNSASRDSGGFLPRPSQGFTQLIYWLGTNGTPGSFDRSAYPSLQNRLRAWCLVDGPRALGSPGDRPVWEEPG